MIMHSIKQVGLLIQYLANKITSDTYIIASETKGRFGIYMSAWKDSPPKYLQIRILMRLFNFDLKKLLSPNKKVIKSCVPLLKTLLFRWWKKSTENVKQITVECLHDTFKSSIMEIQVMLDLYVIRLSTLQEPRVGAE